MKKTLTRIAQGIVLGTTEVIPGVSGSTMALVMGIYDDFIEFLHGLVTIGLALLSIPLKRDGALRFRKAVKAQDWRFGLLIGVGILIAFGLGANILSSLIHTNRQEVYAFFFGLVLASIMIPLREVKAWSGKLVILGAFSALITFVLMGISPVAPDMTPSLIHVFIGGIFGITGMVLPGISGAFILLILGLYDYLIGILKGLTRLQISGSDLLVLAFFAVGVAIGFAVLVKFLKLALDKHRDLLMVVLVGLMIGSLRVLWPFFYEVDGEVVKVLPYVVPPGQLALLVGLILFAIIIVLGIKFLSARKPKAN